MKHRHNYGTFVLPEDPTRRKIRVAIINLVVGFAIGISFCLAILFSR